VIGNTIHDLTRNGVNTDACWGIAVEQHNTQTTGWNIITDNIIYNCSVGIVLGEHGTRIRENLVARNIIKNCAPYGIVSSGLGYNTITNNTIINEFSTYQGTQIHAAILLGFYTPATVQTSNDTVVNNTIICNLTNRYVEGAIVSHQTKYSKITNNNVTTNINSGVVGIKLESYTNLTLVQQNKVQATTGIYIGTTCYYNRLVQNILTGCSTLIVDRGIGTIYE
jgi:hypothetical protein